MQVPFGDSENSKIGAWRYEAHEKGEPGKPGAALQQWYSAPLAE